MYTALTMGNQKTEPYYKAICFCSNCGSRVLPKCVTPNKIYEKRKHFFHNKGVCCDDWYEPISEWHYEWQSYVPIEQREVSIDNGYTKHIADILLTDINPNIVIELQKSNIPFDIKHKRDVFYDKIFWIVHDSIKSMGWVTKSEKPIFIDLLDGNIRTPFGYTIPKQQFVSDILLNPNLKYDDWIFGFDGENILTKYGKQTISDIIPGEHLVFLKEHSFVSQCILCDNHHPQYGELNEILTFNKMKYFQCNYCRKIYQAYCVPDDTRGDDDEIAYKRDIRKLNRFFGNPLLLIREQTKQNKLGYKQKPILKIGNPIDHTYTLQNGILYCSCGVMNVTN